MAPVYVWTALHRCVVKLSFPFLDQEQIEKGRKALRSKLAKSLRIGASAKKDSVDASLRNIASGAHQRRSSQSQEGSYTASSHAGGQETATIFPSWRPSQTTFPSQTSPRNSSRQTPLSSNERGRHSSSRLSKRKANHVQRFHASHRQEAMVHSPPQHINEVVMIRFGGVIDNHDGGAWLE